MAMISLNPFNGEKIAEYKEWSNEEVETAINDSAWAFEGWRPSAFKERADILKNTAWVLKQLKKQLAATITLEMGKPIREAEAEILKCAWVCEYYAENGAKFLEPEVIETDASKSYVSYNPLGPILGVMPWNFPFWQVFRFAAPTLMAGNTALLKHASNVQGCAAEIERIFLEAGLPDNVFRNIPVSGSKVGAIIGNPAVKAVSLTGSEAAGITVSVEASKNIKKSLLELGGSNAFIVLPDADIDKAVEVGTIARMLNTGQSCIASKRFIVLKEVADEFLDKITGAVRSLKMGNPLDPETEVGPLSSVKQAEEVISQVERSLQMGAKLVAGGKKDGCFVEPAILADVRPGMPVMEEEVFGPVLSVYVAESEDEAIQIANSTQFGLGATIFTKDIDKAQKLADRIEDGAVFVNELVKSDPRLPFGGTKRSGFGRELSRHGIYEFVNIKTIYIK